MIPIPDIDPKKMEAGERCIRETFFAVDELALKYGWASAWGHCTYRDVEDLLKKWVALPKKDQEHQISNYFMDRYSANNFSNIEHFFSEWEENPIFNKRMPIFLDCLFALKISNGSFNPSNLVVPVLLSQIDGIIGETLESIGAHYDTKKKVWILPQKEPHETNKGRNDKAFGTLIKNKRTRSGKTYLGNLIHTNSRYELILNGIFQESIHGIPVKEPFILSRNKILHGEDTNYGTNQNALKLFVFLDSLSKFNLKNLVEPDDCNLARFRDPRNW